LRWDKSLNGRHVVVFCFGRNASESRLMIGDELNLKLSPGGEFLFGKPWEARGWVKYIDDGEVRMERGCRQQNIMHRTHIAAP